MHCRTPRQRALSLQSPCPHEVCTYCVQRERERQIAAARWGCQQTVVLRYTVQCTQRSQCLQMVEMYCK